MGNSYTLKAQSLENALSCILQVTSNILNFSRNNRMQRLKSKKQIHYEVRSVLPCYAVTTPQEAASLEHTSVDFPAALPSLPHAARSVTLNDKQTMKKNVGVNVI